jgi:hypothetical protein
MIKRKHISLLLIIMFLTTIALPVCANSSDDDELCEEKRTVEKKKASTKEIKRRKKSKKIPVPFTKEIKINLNVKENVSKEKISNTTPSNYELIKTDIIDLSKNYLKMEHYLQYSKSKGKLPAPIISPTSTSFIDPSIDMEQAIAKFAQLLSPRVEDFLEVAGKVPAHLQHLIIFNPNHTLNNINTLPMTHDTRYWSLADDNLLWPSLIMVAVLNMQASTSETRKLDISDKKFSDIVNVAKQRIQNYINFPINQFYKFVFSALHTSNKMTCFLFIDASDIVTRLKYIQMLSLALHSEHLHLHIANVTDLLKKSLTGQSERFTEAEYVVFLSLLDNRLYSIFYNAHLQSNKPILDLFEEIEGNIKEYYLQLFKRIEERLKKIKKYLLKDSLLNCSTYGWYVEQTGQLFPDILETIDRLFQSPEKPFYVFRNVTPPQPLNPAQLMNTIQN